MIRSSGGIRACRRSRTSPSMAVHSTSNRSAEAAALVPDAVDSLAVLLRDERDRRYPGLALPVRVEEVAERPVPDPPRLVAPAQPDPHPEPMAAVGEDARAAPCARPSGAGGPRRSRGAPRWRRGCGSSRGRPGRASRRAGRGPGRAPRRARRTRSRRWARRSTGGCTRPIRRGPPAGSRRPRDPSVPRATSGRARSRTRR